MAFEHDDGTAAKGQRDGRLLRASPSSFCPTSRANSPGCGVRMRGPPGAARTSARRQGIQRVGVEDHRFGDLLIEPDYQQIEVGERLSPGPQATTVAGSASSTMRSHAANAIRPSPSAGSGAVM